MHSQLKQMDSKEVDLPETVFIRDIENRVFQSIVIQCLSNIEGVALLEGTLIDSLLGRDVSEGVKGIHVEQDQKNHSVQIQMEINVVYGVCIPSKAEEVQNTVAETISTLTGVHVSSVHIVFKNVISMKLEGEGAV